MALLSSAQDRVMPYVIVHAMSVPVRAMSMSVIQSLRGRYNETSVNIGRVRLIRRKNRSGLAGQL